MSASTARSTAPLSSPTDTPIIGCIIPEPNSNNIIPSCEYANATTDPDSSIVEMWLSQISPPELQQMEHDDDDSSSSSSSSSADNNDGRVMMSLGDLLVADDFGNIGSSRHHVAQLNIDEEIHHKDLEYIRAVIAEASSEDDEDSHHHGDDSSEDDDDSEEDLMLQHCILESMASAKEENHQRSNIENCSVSPTQVDDPAVAVLTLNWADIELDEDEQESNAEEPISTQKKLPKKKASKPKPSIIPNAHHTDAFECPWTAWYDPPKGRTARMGIASDAYENKLFEMGLIQCPEDFWTVHEMVDWTNMPCGSMVSFSRVGAKPFWEDPMHSQGGRWIIRGFPRSKSESLFTKVVLSLFLGHFPDPNEFTCVTLQVKEKRRSNAIQLWTRTLDYAHTEEIQEHIFCLVDGWESDDEQQPEARSGRRRRRKNTTRPSSAPKRLHFEFCPNSESIERNAVKLGDIAPLPEFARRGRHHHKSMEVSMESCCNKVSEMYSAGRNKKKSTKERGSKKGGGRGGKVDWSDQLMSMGYGKRRVSQDYDDLVFSQRRSSTASITPKGTPPPSDMGDLTPDKTLQDSNNAAQKRHGHQSTTESIHSSRQASSTKKIISSEDNWRSRSTKTSSTNSTRSRDEFRPSTTSIKNSKDEDSSINSWRRRKDSQSSAAVFIGSRDLECSADGEEPVFVEFDPKLVGLDSWKYNSDDQQSSGNYYDIDNNYNCGWGQPTTNGGWAPYYANSHLHCSAQQYDVMSISPSCGTFDSHGCWYPPPPTATTSSSPLTSEDLLKQQSNGSSGSTTIPSVPSSATTIASAGDGIYFTSSSSASQNSICSVSQNDVANQDSTCHSVSSSQIIEESNSLIEDPEDQQCIMSNDVVVPEWQQYWNAYPPSCYQQPTAVGWIPTDYGYFPNSHSYYPQDATYNYSYNPSEEKVVGSNNPMSEEISRLADSVAGDETKESL